MQYTVGTLKNMINRGENLLDGMKKSSQLPNNEKTLERIWNAAEIGRMVGKNNATIIRQGQQLVESGEMPDFSPSQLHPTTRSVLGYSLEQVNALRKHNNAMPNRNPLLHDEALIMAIQSFKGGVGKSILTAYVSQLLASKGYKVCVVDMDPQASLTNLFGYVADLQIDIADTLIPFFENEETDLKYAIRETNWDGLHLIPSQLGTNDIEIMLSMQAANTPSADRQELVFSKLRRGLDSIKDDYDIVLLDCPPALGVLTLNILSSIDSVIIPTPPALFDFSSTLQYLKTQFKVINSLDPDHQYKFIKILRTKSKMHESAHAQFSAALDAAFGDYLIPEHFPHMTSIEKATINFKTILEDRRPDKKELEKINAAFAHIELEILKTWPSKAIEAAELDAKLNRKETIQEHREVELDHG